MNHPACFDGLPHLPVRVRVGADRAGPATAAQVLATGRSRSARTRAAEGEPSSRAPWDGFVKLTTLRPQMAIAVELYPDSRAFFRALQHRRAAPMTAGPRAVHALHGVAGARSWTPWPRSTRGSCIGRRPASSGGAGPSMRPAAASSRGRPAPAERRSAHVLPGGRRPRRSRCRSRSSGSTRVLQVSSSDATVPYRPRRPLSSSCWVCSPALYSSRRKVWVRAEARRGRAVLQVGGSRCSARTASRRSSRSWSTHVDDARPAGAARPRTREEGGVAMTTEPGRACRATLFNAGAVRLHRRDGARRSRTWRSASAAAHGRDDRSG